jgi:hypothetical protein
MHKIRLVLLVLAPVSFAVAQSTFTVTGTSIPTSLLQQNYGRVPKGIGAYDVSICNASNVKQSVISSEIYQAISESNPGLQPIGKQIMLASILRNQNRSVPVLLNIALNSATSVLAALTSSRISPPAAVVTGTAVASITGQQLLTNLKPVFSADQLEKFEAQVLEPAVVLDAGSCVERTIFTVLPATKSAAKALSLHVR